MFAALCSLNWETFLCQNSIFLFHSTQVESACSLFSRTVPQLLWIKALITLLPLEEGRSWTQTAK